MVKKENIIEEVNGRFKEVVEFVMKEFEVDLKTIAKEIGYKSTRQLYNVFDNKVLISSTAISLLCIGYNLHPNYIIMGIGTISVDDLDNLDLEDYKTTDHLQTLEINRLNKLVTSLKTTIHLLTEK